MIGLCVCMVVSLCGNSRKYEFRSDDTYPDSFIRLLDERLGLCYYYVDVRLSGYSFSAASQAVAFGAYKEGHSWYQDIGSQSLVSWRSNLASSVRTHFFL